ncbi:MAG: PUR family DNA/RNA-binding protein [Bacteroidaceae bacterium]|nr:PUR family DNA/RNA-binding protein [Bacteroidaceae bacterium]
MNDLDRDLVFSESVKAGKRIYYFDVKQSRNGDRYIAITESKKINEGTIDNPRFSFEKHKLFLYKEDYEKFVGALVKTLEVAKTGIIPEPEQVEEQPYAPYEQPAPAPAPEAAEVAPEAAEEPVSTPQPIKIDLDF